MPQVWVICFSEPHWGCGEGSWHLVYKASSFSPAPQRLLITADSSRGSLNYCLGSVVWIPFTIVACQLLASLDLIASVVSCQTWSMNMQTINCAIKAGTASIIFAVWLTEDNMQKYFISTDISQYILCGFGPQLMYIQNKQCSAGGCLLLFCSIISFHPV